MDPGIYHISFEEYQAIPAVNASALKRLHLSPAAFRCGVETGESEAMRAGTLTHLAVLEPERFEREVAVMPRFHGGMKDENAIEKGYEGGREAKAAWESEHEGATIVDGATRDECLGIAAAVRKCEPARVLLTSGESEVTIVWEDPIGVLCKARLDHLFENNQGGHTIADLKKTTSVAPRAFQREHDRLEMDISATFYLRGWGILHDRPYDPLDFAQADAFVWVAFESRPPHYCRVYELEAPTRDMATQDIERMLSVVRWCEQRNEWPDYSERVYRLGRSAYREGYKLPDDYKEIES